MLGVGGVCGVLLGCFGVGSCVEWLERCMLVWRLLGDAWNWEMLWRDRWMLLILCELGLEEAMPEFGLVALVNSWDHVEDKLMSNLSRLTVIIWVFVVLILTSSYTASLTSLLTVQQLKPTVTDVKDLLKNGDYVGYQDGSFVVHLLDQLKFDKNKLRSLSTPEQYVVALSKGNNHDGVAAIFDEIPYLRLLLSEHCSDYTVVGRTYKTDGFGFVFPRGSPLVPDISRAVLNVTEGDTMTEIERKWFGDPSNCPTQSDSFSSTSLDFRNFGGLFLVTGAVSSMALFIFIADFLYTEWKELKAAGNAAGGSFKNRIKAWAKYYDSKHMKSNTSTPTKEKYMITGNVNVNDPVAPLHGDESQSPNSNYSVVNLGPPHEGYTQSQELHAWRVLK